MQLILNSDTDLGIQRKMSVIEQETYEETFKIKNVSQDLNSELSNINETVSSKQNILEKCIDEAESNNLNKSNESIPKNTVKSIDDENVRNENTNDELNDQCQNGTSIEKSSDSIEEMETDELDNIDNVEVKCDDVKMVELQLEKSESSSIQLNQENNVDKNGPEDIVANCENNENLSEEKNDDITENTVVLQSVLTETGSDNNLKLNLDTLKAQSEDLESTPDGSKSESLNLDTLKVQSDDLESTPDGSKSESLNLGTFKAQSEDLESIPDGLKSESDDLNTNLEKNESANYVKTNSDCMEIDTEDLIEESKNLTLDSNIPETEFDKENQDTCDMKVDTDGIKSDLSNVNIDSNIQKLHLPPIDNEPIPESVENGDVINIPDEKDDERNALEQEIKDVKKPATLLETESKIIEESTNNDIIIEKQIEGNNVEETEHSHKVSSEDKEITKLEDHKNKTTEKVIDKNDQDKVVPSSNISNNPKKLSHICKLSNTLDILSDEEDEEVSNNVEESQKESIPSEKQCIQIEDDDDIMLIDDDSTSKSENNNVQTTPEITPSANENDKDKQPNGETNEKNVVKKNTEDTKPLETDLDKRTPEKTSTCPEETPKPRKPLLPLTFLKTCKKNLVEMTRSELEEFCILKIVESVVDRSNLNEIKTQLKAMAQNIEEHKKKAMSLTKQNRDLQVVLKSVQEEQKKKSDLPITPLKITRSVGMQVFMTDKSMARRKPSLGPNNLLLNGPGNGPANKQNKSQLNQSPKLQKPQANTNNTQQIPVPRLVPASNNINNTKPSNANYACPTKAPGTPTTPNGVKNSPPVQKPVKRSNSKIGGSVTVDLTDDEPPAKVIQLNINPPVRLVPPQNLLAPQRQPFNATMNSPRKVYIPISGSQNQVRPGQTIMLKPLVPQGPRQKTHPAILPKQNTSMRMTRINSRHPAPLPDCMKQYQPPNWKALPPAPELKLSKVENGIVISWKIDGYQEDNHEEIASYQLYAYQETSSPPSTGLWKKIGDVKALPLPMACTLTQFMAGYKYYFAVRAVDIRSRLGPFSAPGSILLLNKM